MHNRDLYKFDLRKQESGF